MLYLLGFQCRFSTSSSLSHVRVIECKTIWLEKQKVPCEQYFKPKYEYLKL